MKRIISAVVAIIGLAVPACTGFDQGWAAYVRGDYATAVLEWRLLAEQGDGTAQLNLGHMYVMGYQGVPRDRVEAVRWYRKAGSQGLATAQSRLGFMYYTGQGVPQDYVEAVRWYRKAAEQRYPGSQRNLDLAETQRLAQAWRPKKEVATLLPPTPAPGIARQRIVRVQRDLASLGYDHGPADGIMDRKTRAVIREFQAKMGLPITGEISKGLEIAIRAAKRTIASMGATPQDDPLKMRFAGSGIVVSTTGHVLTNHHVVKGCRSVGASTGTMVESTGISVRPKPKAPVNSETRQTFGRRTLKVLDVDAQNDLALLKSVEASSTAVAFRGGRAVRAGEDVIVTGFPLHGLLSSDLNITKGIVSALAGPGNNRRLIQITAPVQRGNSGGPVLDQSGHVVGVVVGRLDALKLARLTGTLPQNVNFAISEVTARAFLDANNVPYEVEPSDKPLPTADIAAKARDFTVRVECWK